MEELGIAALASLMMDRLTLAELRLLADELLMRISHRRAVEETQATKALKEETMGISPEMQSMPWKTAKWVVFDTETTGLNEEGQYIVQLAAVDMEMGLVKTVRQMLLNPQRDISVKATEVHHITNDMVAESPTFESIAMRLLDVVHRGEVLVAYNAPFDFAFLDREFARTPFLDDWGQLLSEKIIVDPLTMIRTHRCGKYWKARWKGERRHTLTHVAERLNIAPPPGEAHAAKYDAKLAGKVLWALAEDWGCNKPSGFGWPKSCLDMAKFIINKRQGQDYDREQYWKRQRGSEAGGTSKHRTD